MKHITYFILLFSFISVSLSLGGCRKRIEVPITGVERIGEGVLIAPEAIATDSNGFLYTGIYDGSIKKINPDTLEISTYLSLHNHRVFTII